MINKSQAVQVKVLDEASGVVEAYVNSMGIVDKDNDIIEPSAFDKSISDNLPIPVLSGHDQQTVVGKVVTARPVSVDGEDWKLFAVMQMNLETQDGREAFSNVKGEYVREWSVGFNIPDGAWDMESRDGVPVRIIKELDWVEVSTVVRGASPQTATVAAKTVPDATPPAEEAKPMTNFHACRVREPADFDEFRTTTRTMEEGPYSGKQIEFLWGHSKESGEWEQASYHMPAEEWTEAEARGFCKEHSGILFEPAKQANSASDTVEETASDTDVAFGQLTLLRTQLELKNG